MPFIKKQPDAYDKGMDKSSRHLFQNHNGIVLNISQGGRHGGYNFAQPVFIEIPHGHVLHVFAYFQPFFRTHGKAAKRSPNAG